MDGVRQLQNRILNSLPPDIFCEIIPSLEPVTLERGQVIVTADQPIDYLYFLCRGIGSVITVSSSGQLAEAGMVGREGFGPTSDCDAGRRLRPPDDGARRTPPY
jgi:CRP-like cAMP-binding protein